MSTLIGRTVTMLGSTGFAFLIGEGGAFLVRERRVEEPHLPDDNLPATFVGPRGEAGCT